MEKQKRWQLAVIVAVLVLTLYNILPTIIYYSKPLSSPITETRAVAITEEIGARVNGLEVEAREWLESFCKLLSISPKEIRQSESDPSLIEVSFKDKKAAAAFRKFLPVAGLEIPFVPAQLGLIDANSSSTTVSVARRIGIHFKKEHMNELFKFSAKFDAKGNITPFYFDLVADRIEELAVAMNGNQALKREVEEFVENGPEKRYAIQAVAERLSQVATTFGDKSPITQRFFKTVATDSTTRKLLITKFEEEKKTLSANTAKPDEALQKTLTKAIAALHAQENAKDVKAITKDEITAFMQAQFAKAKQSRSVYVLSLQDRHPLFREVQIDWANDRVMIYTHPEVDALFSSKETSELQDMKKEYMNRWIMNEVARVAQVTGESIAQEDAGFRLSLSKLTSSTSLLAFNMNATAKAIAALTLEQMNAQWKPVHQEFASDKLPRFNETGFQAASSAEKKLSCVVLAPTEENPVIAGLRPGSIYVVLRGFQNLYSQYENLQETADGKLFMAEFQALAELLQKRGFIGYMGTTPGAPAALQNDYVFELNDFYSTLLKATREDFTVLGGKKYAVLEFTDVEQRILTENRIDDAIQEDLLKAKELYMAAQVDMNPLRRFTVPAPTENVYLSNFKLATRKYFRGDDSKILRWGLDLSGGKSVRIQLIDSSGKTVTSPEELKQAVNELYTRINNMGVSERTIRIENETILLDFPGSQALSASELVKASAMYFHIVNEQFGPYNKELSKEVHSFLQEVWNEAVVTNRQDQESLNEIAYQKLATAAKTQNAIGPKTSAQILYDKGLRLANPKDSRATASVNESVSMIARWSGDDQLEWSRQTHPLMIVFRNFALEGSSLEGVQASYDPSKGNILLFSVKGSYAKNDGNAGNPRDDFYAWTSQFSQEGIIGTTREAYSPGHGWRMAVVLNGQVVSAPSLNNALRDHAMISGNFSQRQVQNLATDLRAGSLSFTPRILSEQNVSPELGVEERTRGIGAAIIAVLAVVVVMIGYYRFAGIVASIAVLINILIIWAVMQNLDAALTLPGIAGMVLTVGMAVDANVLVFERIREEFKLTGRIASAIQAGYQKAFSAIFDSNITTIMVALILLQFDCGPIRSFATTLIIGITSSMFTALFMTRYFFAGWVENPSNKHLTMAEWIKSTNFDFLKMARPAIYASIALFAVGALVFAGNWKSMIGMDFTGGYSIVLEVENEANARLPEKVHGALVKAGVRTQEVQVRELGRSQLLRIQLATSLEQEARPFYNMPEELIAGTFAYEYQKNPRLNFVVGALKASGIEIKASELPHLQHNWTVMSGQFSDAMRNNAIMALSLAFFAVLIYIAIRFELKYAVSAVIALLHDVLLTLAVMAIANRCGLPVQLNLETIGAIMTIIGYSLNDTIIVFDRIREDIRIHRKMKFAEIINFALNQTLSRTLMTSGTTLIVLLALDIFAGSSIFGFAFVMTMGIFLGTLSSLFIAAPILLWLHDKQEAVK